MTREAAILSLAPRVKWVVDQFAFRVPDSVTRAELETAAWRGAITSVDRFQPALGPSLATFATWRIRGEIQDYLRSLDHLTRGARKEEKAEGGLSAIHLVSLDTVQHDGSPRDRFPDPRSRDEFDRIDARLDVETLIRRAHLPARTLDVVRSRNAGVPNKILADRYGVHVSRIAQINREGLNGLRRAV